MAILCRAADMHFRRLRIFTTISNSLIGNALARNTSNFLFDHTRSRDISRAFHLRRLLGRFLRLVL